MKSLLIIPKEQTSKAVKSVKIEISKDSKFTDVLYSNIYLQDKSVVTIDDAYTNVPLYMRITKTFTDNTTREYRDKNPVSRGEVSLLLEDNYLTSLPFTYTTAIVNGDVEVTVTLKRPVTSVFISMYKMDGLTLIDSDIKNNKTFSVTLDKRYGSKALLYIVGLFNNVRYKQVLLPIPLTVPTYIRDLKSIYYTDTDTYITVESTDGYELYVDDTKVPTTVNHIYDIRPYLPYGETCTIQIKTNKGVTIDKEIATVPHTRGYQRDVKLVGHTAPSSLSIDGAIPLPLGDIIHQASFYIAHEDGKGILYAYYIPADSSRKLNPHFNIEDNIKRVYKIDDTTLAIHTQDTLTIYTYTVGPLSLSRPVSIPLPYVEGKCTYHSTTRKFYYMQDSKMYAIDLLGIKQEITTPTHTAGYISTSQVVNIAVILDKVLYTYDTTTSKWNTIHTLPTGCDMNNLLSIDDIEEGLLITLMDGTLYKYQHATSDIVKMTTTIANIKTMNKIDHSIYYTLNNDVKLYRLT